MRGFPEINWEMEGAMNRFTDDFDDEDDDDMDYDPFLDCPSCRGEGKCALISGIEWDYCGPDYDTCPRCGGTGRR